MLRPPCLQEIQDLTGIEPATPGLGNTVRPAFLRRRTGTEKRRNIRAEGAPKPVLIRANTGWTPPGEDAWNWPESRLQISREFAFRRVCHPDLPAVEAAGWSVYDRGLPTHPRHSARPWASSLQPELDRRLEVSDVRARTSPTSLLTSILGLAPHLRRLAPPHFQR